MDIKQWILLGNRTTMYKPQLLMPRNQQGRRSAPRPDGQVSKLMPEFTENQCENTYHIYICIYICICIYILTYINMYFRNDHLFYVRVAVRIRVGIYGQENVECMFEFGVRIDVRMYGYMSEYMSGFWSE